MYYNISWFLVQSHPAPRPHTPLPALEPHLRRGAGGGAGAAAAGPPRLAGPVPGGAAGRAAAAVCARDPRLPDRDTCFQLSGFRPPGPPKTGHLKELEEDIPFRSSFRNPMPRPPPRRGTPDSTPPPGSRGRAWWSDPLVRKGSLQQMMGGTYGF